MKRFAYKIENGEYEKTNVWEVARGKKKNPHLWKNVEFRSTHRKPENRKPMKYMPRTENKRAYFSYIGKRGEKIYEGHDTTLTHEVCQNIISELEEITFKINNRGGSVFKIYVSQCEIEEEIKTKNGSYYYVDVLVRFEKSEPEYLAIKWNGAVAVEIYVTHKVDQTKINDLCEIGIPIIEIEVSKKLRIDESRELTAEDIKEKTQYIKSYYEKEIYAKLIGDYSSKEYLEMVEIEELKKKVNILENQNKLQNEEVQHYKVLANNLKAENTNLSRQLNEKVRELSVIKVENEKLMKSLWYKVHKIFVR